MNTRCALCGKPGPLCDSHILPEFVYRPSYDATHTAILFDEGKTRKGKVQKGFSERLLCKSCEMKFNQWETYFANVWFNRHTRLRASTLPSRGIIQLPPLDYPTFKLFHMSLVWRAGVSRHRAFANVRLGAHEPELRRHLWQSDPGAPADYPFIGIALRDNTVGGFQDELIGAPSRARLEGHYVYTFIFGGVLWHYYIMSRRAGIRLPLYFDGILTLEIQDWLVNPFVRRLMSRARRGP